MMSWCFPMHMLNVSSRRGLTAWVSFIWCNRSSVGKCGWHLQKEVATVVLQMLEMKPFLNGLWFYGSIFHLLDRGATSYDGRPMHSVKLIISEVSREDYEQPFVCQASNAFGQVASYIILKHRGKKYYYFEACDYLYFPRRCFDTKSSCIMLKKLMYYSLQYACAFA